MVKAGVEMNTSSRRRDTLTKAIQALLTGDVLLCEQTFTADVIWTSPTITTTSRDELETRLSNRAGALANIDLSIIHLVDDGASAMAEWHVGADHVQPFFVPEDTRLDPGGEGVSLAGVTVADFDGLRISAIRHYFDKATLLGQLLPD